MKRAIALLLITIILAGCGHPAYLTPPGQKGREYPTYGLFNENSSKSKHVCYEASVGNVVWSIILFETVVAPLYFIGYSLFNPVGVKNANGECGIDG